MLELPKDLTKISSPFIAFCGDSNLSSFIADRFFRDGSTHYNIEFLNNQDEKNMIQKIDKQKTNVEYIMKGSWYEKHSQKYPALCLFCISVDLTKFTQDRSSWLQSVKEQFSEIVNWFPEKKPAFLSIFVCPGNKDGLLQNGIREDMLIRDLNSLTITHLHSYLFFEEELIGSSYGNIKSMKAEIYQICHSYYSDRLDVLDSDMQTSQSIIPPSQFIRMMLKMCFFNECLSSLTLQDNNVSHTYNRCLEYYSRVQDYCISLFSEMKNYCSEEIRQVLSVVNYKVIMYTLLLQQSKGIISLVKKIIRCIHALSAILHTETSSLFSLWKASQFQFLIDIYSQVVTTPDTSTDVQLSLQSCYYYRLYYAREAYLLSLESSLCCIESLPSSTSTSSSSLFLAMNCYSSQEEYLQDIIKETDFRTYYLNCLKYNQQYSIPSLFSSSYLDMIDSLLSSLQLPTDEMINQTINRLLQCHSFTLLKMILLAYSYVAWQKQDQTRLIGFLFILLSSSFSLPLSTRQRFFSLCQEVTTTLPSTLVSQYYLPLEWCLLTQTLSVYDNQQVDVKLILHNTYPVPLTCHEIKVEAEISEGTVIEIYHNTSDYTIDSLTCISLSLPASSIHSSLKISLYISQFSSFFPLLSSFNTISQTPYDLSHIDVNQLQVLPTLDFPIVSIPKEEKVIAGQVNTLIFPLHYSEWKPLTIHYESEDKEIEAIYSYEQNLINEQNELVLKMDLTDSKWFDYSKQPTIILHIQVNDIIKDYSFTLHIQSPFTCSLDCSSIQGHYYSIYHNQIVVSLHCLLDHLIIHSLSISTSSKVIGKLIQEDKKDLICQANNDYQWKSTLQVPIQEIGIIEGNSIIIHYSLNTISGVFTLHIPPLYLEKPPVVYSIDLADILEKGTPSNGSLLLTNQSNDIQEISVVLKRNSASWILNGVIDCSYSLLPGESIHHAFSIIPTQIGSQDYSLASICLTKYNMVIEDFFTPKHVFVKDSDCIL